MLPVPWPFTSRLDGQAAHRCALLHGIFRFSAELERSGAISLMAMASLNVDCRELPPSCDFSDVIVLCVRSRFNVLMRLFSLRYSFLNCLCS